MVVNNKVNESGIESKNIFIQTCIYDSPGMKILIDYIIKNANYIDYSKANKKNADSNLESGFKNSFVISKIDESNKYSKEYYNCTGIIAIGKSKLTGNNISFLTHQNNIGFLKVNNYLDIFKNSLIKSLNELNENSINGTIDIVIGGGNDLGKMKDYIETVEYLNELIFDTLGIKVSIVGGPSINKNKIDNNKDLIIDTQKRNLYLFKKYSEVSENIDFFANKIKEIF